jgi:hypothetical protein
MGGGVGCVMRIVVCDFDLSSRLICRLCLVCQIFMNLTEVPANIESLILVVNSYKGVMRSLSSPPSRFHLLTSALCCACVCDVR